MEEVGKHAVSVRSFALIFMELPLKGTLIRIKLGIIVLTILQMDLFQV